MVVAVAVAVVVVLTEDSVGGEVAIDIGSYSIIIGSEGDVFSDE